MADRSNVEGVEADCSVDEVCEFLVKRKVDEMAVQRMKEEKMDGAAIQSAADQLLKDFGLAFGDIIALKAYCQRWNNENERKTRKQHLYEKIFGKKAANAERFPLKKTKSVGANNACKTMKVYLGWQHYVSDQERYKQVRLAKGGGNREVFLPLSSSYADILEVAVSTFFPCGESSVGLGMDMKFKLGNFQGEEIVEISSFTLNSYRDLYNLPRLKIYLLSKEKSRDVQTRIKRAQVGPKLNSKCRTTPKTSLAAAVSGVPSKVDEMQLESDDEEVSFKGFGTHSESADIDDTVIDTPPNDHSNPTALMPQQLLVDDESDDELPSYLGSQGQRSFSLSKPEIEVQPATPDLTCEICRDALGGLQASAHPLGCSDTFHLACLREWHKTADSGTIKCPVCEKEFSEIVTPPSAESRERDQSNQELGARKPASSLKKEKRGYWFRQNMLPNLPATGQFLEEGGSKEAEQSIQKRQNEALAQLYNEGDAKSVFINRENIVQDMLKLYKDKSITKSILNVSFINEAAVDLNGVKREAFTLFWEKAMLLYFNGTTSYVPRISPSIDESIYTILGRIITHGYVMVGVFPTSISKIFFTALVAGKETLTDNDFLEGYLDYVSEYDSLKVRTILEECHSQQSLSASSTSFLLDFLSEYNVSTMPNADNLRTILVNVSKTELWNKTLMAANCMREGILEGVSHVWGSATKELVTVLYKSFQVTTDKVLSMIVLDDPSGLTKGQELVFTYFKKFVRSLGEKELARFLRYVTGSSFVAVHSIKVIFHSHIGSLPHVSVHACSAVVDLPSGGYDGFTDFKTQMDEVLKNAESWKFTLV